MNETKKNSTIRKVYEVILEKNLETFGINEVDKALEQEYGPVKIRNKLDEISQKTKLSKVDDNPKIYSIHSYQSSKDFNDLELVDRIALDELAQYILTNESLEGDKAKQIVEECYEISDMTSLLKRTSEVEDSFRELEFIDYDFHEDTYRLSDQNIQGVN